MTLITKISTSFFTITLLCELFNYLVLEGWLDLPYLNLSAVSDLLFIVYVLCVFLAIDYELYKIKNGKSKC